MNANPAFNFARHAATFALAFQVATATAQISTNSLLSLVRTNTETTSLSISNTGNQVWIIQSSSNLTTWKTVDSL